MDGDRKMLNPTQQRLPPKNYFVNVCILFTITKSSDIATAIVLLFGAPPIANVDLGLSSLLCLAKLSIFFIFRIRQRRRLRLVHGAHNIERFVEFVQH